MNIILNNKVLDAIDMSFANPTISFSSKSGYEHYRFLAYISGLFENKILIDIGTRVGSSAIAMARSGKTIVHSFDIEDIPGKVTFPNVTYHVCDVLKSDHQTMILGSPFISLDTAHDGVFERQFLEFLRQNKYRGILYLDDINTDMFGEMRKVWAEIGETKIDITKYGHFSGSGIVIFDTENVNVICE
jgi:hypothetical protein